MMKFLAFSDTHGSYQSAQKIITMSEEVDLLVCIGDFTHVGQYGELFLDRISSVKKPLYLVSGNHEESPSNLFTDLVHKYDFAHNLEQTTKQFQEITFCGCSFDASRETSQELQRLKVQDTKPDVFLTHCPPRNTPAAFGKRDGGSLTIRSFIEEVQPQLVLCGHIHRPQQRECFIGKSKIVNVACQYYIFEM